MRQLFSRFFPSPRPSSADGFPRFQAVGDCGLLVELGDRIEDLIYQRVISVNSFIEQASIPGVIETIISYASVLIRFDPLKVDPADLRKEIEKRLKSPVKQTKNQCTWHIPVNYGGRAGRDLEKVAQRLGLSNDDIISAHQGATYTIYMFGFLPGFAYLGGLPPELALPRRKTPRPAVPQGSITIGGAQAAICSIEGPCGWHIIGRTPVRTFAPSRDPVTFLHAGDRIRFRRIDEKEFEELDQRARQGHLVAEQLT